MHKSTYTLVYLLTLALPMGGPVTFAGATEPESVIARVLYDYLLETEEGECA